MIFAKINNWLLSRGVSFSKKGLAIRGLVFSWIVIAGMFTICGASFWVANEYKSLDDQPDDQEVALDSSEESQDEEQVSTEGTGQTATTKKKSTTSSGSGSTPPAAPVPGPGEPETPTAVSKQVAVYLPYWDMENAFSSLQANADKISVAHPVWYYPNSAGGIEQFTGAGNGAIINFSRSNNIKIIPSLNNECNPTAIEQVLSDSGKTATHIQNIISLVGTYGYDGVDIDYECFTNVGLKDSYSNFIGNLANELHSRGKYLTTAVHAKTSDAGGWSGTAAQDWSAIGNYVDQMLIMTYDYHWNTSAAGDIAPLSWMQSVLSYGKTKVNASKILLGIHFYGYDWVGTSGTDKTYNEIQAIIAAHSPNVSISGETEKYFTYNDGSPHTVYFADRDVVAPRVNLVNSYSVAGIGIWRIGQEDSENWQKIDQAF